MQDCIFCKMINDEIPSHKIYEDEHVIAILDIRPVSRGHALVIPKKHSADILDADGETLSASMLRVKKIAPAILKATGAGGFNTHINTGAAAGQVVFHTHIHVIPRFASDGIKMWEHTDAEPKTLEQIALEIKKHLA